MPLEWFTLARDAWHGEVCGRPIGRGDVRASSPGLYQMLPWLEKHHVVRSGRDQGDGRRKPILVGPAGYLWRLEELGALECPFTDGDDDERDVIADLATQTARFWGKVGEWLAMPFIAQAGSSGESGSAGVPVDDVELRLQRELIVAFARSPFDRRAAKAIIAVPPPNPVAVLRRARDASIALVAHFDEPGVALDVSAADRDVTLLSELGVEWREVGPSFANALARLMSKAAASTSSLILEELVASPSRLAPPGSRRGGGAGEAARPKRRRK